MAHKSLHALMGVDTTIKLMSLLCHGVGMSQFSLDEFNGMYFEKEEEEPTSFDMIWKSALGTSARTGSQITTIVAVKNSQTIMTPDRNYFKNSQQLLGRMRIGTGRDAILIRERKFQTQY